MTPSGCSTRPRRPARPTPPRSGAIGSPSRRSPGASRRSLRWSTTAAGSPSGSSQRALDDPSYLTAATLRRDYLEGPADGLPVPFNRIMVATFFLTGMDIAHRLISWFDGLELPWERAMVIIAGRQGRPTAGVSQESNSVAGVIHAASRDRLPPDRLLIAPHAPVFPMFDGTNLDSVAALEGDYRRQWSWLLATSELGAQMFDGYPRFEPLPAADGQRRPGQHEWVHERSPRSRRRRLVRPDDAAARGHGGPAATALGRRHRLREPAAGRARTTSPRP